MIARWPAWFATKYAHTTSCLNARCLQQCLAPTTLSTSVRGAANKCLLSSLSVRASCHLYYEPKTKPTARFNFFFTNSCSKTTRSKREKKTVSRKLNRRVFTPDIAFHASSARRPHARLSTPLLRTARAADIVLAHGPRLPPCRRPRISPHRAPAAWRFRTPLLVHALRAVRLPVPISRALRWSTQREPEGFLGT